MTENFCEKISLIFQKLSFISFWLSAKYAYLSRNILALHIVAKEKRLAAVIAVPLCIFLLSYISEIPEWLGGYFCDNWKPSFLPRISFN